MLNVRGNKDGTVTNKTPLDQFLSEDRHKEDPEISLYDWARKCNCPLKDRCGQDHVPVFTGCVTTWALGQCVKSLQKLCEWCTQRVLG